MVRWWYFLCGAPDSPTAASKVIGTTKKHNDEVSLQRTVEVVAVVLSLLCLGGFVEEHDMRRHSCKPSELLVLLSLIT
jgi:hypothetical protein